MNLTEILQPIAVELPLVEDTLSSVASVEYPLLADLLGHVMKSTGKRLRPAVTLLAGQLFTYSVPSLVPMATAMELLHTASLVHDDMVDDAETRRGQNTLNSLVSGKAAVLVGDYLFAKSAHLVAQTANIRAMTLFAETLMTIVNGELRQLFTTFEWRQTRNDYYDKIYGKTASLFATSAQSGAILGNATDEQVEALRDYGYNVGMAFQIVDDILDYTGTSEEVGKPVASDLRQGTVTLPALLLIERNSTDNPIRRLFESGRVQEDAGNTVQLIREAGAIEESLNVAREFVDRAKRALANCPAGPARDSLEQLADYVTARSF